MWEGDTHSRYINLQFSELYHDVFWYEQVKYRNISFARLVAVVVKNMVSKRQVSRDSNLWYKRIARM